MKKHLLYLVFTALILVPIYTMGVQTEKPFFHIDTITGDNPFAYQFPFVVDNEKLEIANKINEIIQFSVVGKKYNGSGIDFFSEMLTNDNGWTSGRTHLEFSIEVNTPSMLVFSFSENYYSAKAGSRSYSLNFNSSTGELIYLTDLFTKDGIKNVNDYYSKKINEKLNTRFKSILDETVDIDKQKILRANETILFLSHWNYTHDFEKMIIDKSGVSVTKYDQYPRNTNLAFSISWWVPIELDKIRSWTYTDLGKNLLLKGKSDYTSANSTPNERRYHIGKIDNKYRFCLELIFENDKFYSAKYWYSKYGKMIDLEEKWISRNKLELKENGGKFIFDFSDGDILKATWINNDGTVFPIMFE